MSKIKRLFLNTVAAAAIGCTTVYPLSAQLPQSSPEVGLTSSTASVERMGDLIRLWNFVRLFHVDSRAMTPEWERALEKSAASAFAAEDAHAFAQVAKSMMDHIQPSPPQPAISNEHAIALPEFTPFRLVAGRAVASCPAIARAPAANGQTRAKEEELVAIQEHGLILDCRGFSPGAAGRQERIAFSQWFDFAAPSLLQRPLERGAMRMRFHDGFPPDTGQTSGGYARGTSDVSIPRLESAPESRARAPRFVIIADATTPDPWLLVGGLQAEGIGSLVAQGSLANPQPYHFRSKHLNVAVKVEDYIAPNGRVGIHPDSCVSGSSWEEAVTVATALLDGNLTAPCPAPIGVAALNETAASAADPSSPTSDGSRPLTLGERMVGLAKLWGTIEYFFPYHSHTDTPWSATLEEFIPIFAAATTREEYEEAVQRLAQRTNDSHVTVVGTRQQRLNQVFTPAIYIRPIDDRFAIAELHDPDLSDRLRPGDEILAVDGRPADQIVSELRSLIAASTAQSFAGRVAGLITAGPEDSEVRLSIRRGESAPFDVVVKRTLRYGAQRRPKTNEPTFSRIAPDIGYVDLDRLTWEEADDAIDELMDTRAIIFDLRGYPQGTAWKLAPRLALDGREGAVGALFRRPVYRSASLPRRHWTSSSQTVPTSTKTRYRGKIVVLIDERAISQSEHTALFLEAVADPVFVGTPTTGANGDVTTVGLPGELFVRFTGHDIRHADGRQLQRVGIEPDVLITPSFAGLMSGRDEVLEAGLTEARRELSPAAQPE